MDSCSREGEWYCLKSGIPLDKTEEVVAYYKKTWRYVELKEEKGE